jgi:hypothetical protein
MAFALLADLTALLHLAFIVFVVAGGLLVPRWPKVLWAHLAAAAWGTYVSLANRVCPLTPLENWLSLQAGKAGHGGGFIEHYLLPFIYPADLTPGVQRGLGVGAVLINAAVYAWVAARRARH